MKKIISFILSCIIYSSLQAKLVIPTPIVSSFVVDYAHLLTPEQISSLNSELLNFEDSTSNQIAVLIIPTLQNEPIEDVANHVFREWGIGTKKNNNGVLLLIAISDKKLRIEVGYGLEGKLPDLLSNEIINHDIVPSFKQNDFFRGIQKGVKSIELATQGEYKKNKNSDNDNSWIIFIIIMVIVILLLKIMNNNSRNGGTRGRFSSLIFLPFIAGGSTGGDNNSGFGGGSSGGGGSNGSW